jgi:hypothetical protein
MPVPIPPDYPVVWCFIQHKDSVFLYESFFFFKYCTFFFYSCHKETSRISQPHKTAVKIVELRVWICKHMRRKVKKSKAIPRNRPWGPIRLWDVESPTFSRQSAHRWRWSCQPYAPAGGKWDRNRNNNWDKNSEGTSDSLVALSMAASACLICHSKDGRGSPVR